LEELDTLTALDLLPHPPTTVTAGDPEKPGRRGGVMVAWVSWEPRHSGEG